MNTRRPERPAGREAGAAGLRAGAEGLAHLQPAGCAPGDLGDRASALHPACAHPGARRGAELLRQPRGAGLSDAGGRSAHSRSRRRPVAGARHERARRFPGRAGHRRAAAEGTADAVGGFPRWPGVADRGGGPCAWQGAMPSPRRAVWPCASSAWRCRHRNRRSSDAVRRWPPPSTRPARPRAPRRRSRRAAASTWNSWAARPIPRAMNACRYTGVKAGAAARAPAAAASWPKRSNALPIPKRMRWGAGEAQFVRPVHWLVLLLGRDVIPATILDVRGRQPGARPSIPLHEAAAHHIAGRLRAHAGDAGLRDRRLRGASRTHPRGQSLQLAAQQGGRALISDALLDEVTSLVEWPVPLAGQFEERFLALPRELLISVLQDHQRYFPVEGADGRLLPWFITVSNVDSRDMNVVRAGNERVVRPRLSDAAFFWEQDRKPPLARAPGTAGCRHLPGAAGLHRRQGASHRAAGPRHRRAHRWRWRTGRARRSACQVRPGDEPCRRVPRAAGHSWAATTPPPTVSPRR